MTAEQSAHLDRLMAVSLALSPLHDALQCVPHARRAREYADAIYTLLASLPRDSRREALEQLVRLIRSDLH